MDIANIVKQEDCLFISSKTKTEVLLEFIDHIDKSGNCRDIENLKKEIFYREQIMSTGIGRGIAVPHVRFEGADKPQVYIGLSGSGIKDYESIDNEVVKIVVMIIVGSNQHKEYLRILSLLIKKINNCEYKSRLLECSSSEEIVTLLKSEDVQ